VTVSSLIPHSDARGSLCELLTTRDGRIEPIVHIYQVTALSGSIRAWVYHRWQHDRLAFPNGQFRLVLYDIRSSSPTFNLLNVFHLGCEQPGLLRIPPWLFTLCRTLATPPRRSSICRPRHTTRPIQTNAACLSATPESHSAWIAGKVS